MSFLVQLAKGSDIPFPHSWSCRLDDVESSTSFVLFIGVSLSVTVRACYVPVTVFVTLVVTVFVTILVCGIILKVLMSIS